MADAAFFSVSKRIDWLLQLDYSAWIDCKAIALEETFIKCEQRQKGKIGKSLELRKHTIKSYHRFGAVSYFPNLYSL